MVYTNPLCRDRNIAAVLVALLIVIQGDGALQAQDGPPADNTLSVQIVPRAHIGVSFGLLPIDATEAMVVLTPPDGWGIVTDGSSTRAMDHSGVTIWHRRSTTESQHTWKGFGLSDANKVTPQNIITSGTYVRFAGTLKPLDSHGPGDSGSPWFGVSVADININVDSGIPPRHEGDHWEPWAHDGSTVGRIEDLAESGGPGSGMYLPRSIIGGDGDLPPQLPNLNNVEWKTLRVRIRTAWGATPLEQAAGTLSFDFSGGGFALYAIGADEGDGVRLGTKITNQSHIPVPPGGFSHGVDFAIVTNESFTSPGGITAKFQWADPPREGARFAAFDDVRLAPVDWHVGLSVDSDNDGRIGILAREELIKPFKPGVLIRINRHDLGAGHDELKHCLVSPRHGWGTLKLEAVEGADRIKIWENETKLPGTEIPQNGWDLSASSPPAPVYLDGTELGSGKLKLTYIDGDIKEEDLAAFHVTQTTSWSPRRKTVVTWEPEPTLLDYPGGEVLAETESQGFIPTEFVYPNIGSFEQFKSLRDAGVLAWHAHGGIVVGGPSDGERFLTAMVGNSQQAVQDWLGLEDGEPLPDGISIFPGGPGEFVAAVRVPWLKQHWEHTRNVNHSIGFFFGCRTAEPNPHGDWKGHSICTAAGGRVNFGYDGTTIASQNADDARLLLRRMNGRYGQRRLRTAGEAYDDPDNLCDGGEFSEGFKMLAPNQTAASWTTLAAAPYEWFHTGQESLYTYPPGHDYAGQQLGFACLIFDSYMDTSTRANDALVVGIGGDGKIYDRYWIGGYAVGFYFRRAPGVSIFATAPAHKCRNDGVTDMEHENHSRPMDASRRAPADPSDEHTWSF